jgi:EAL and modified HD-GYP domain-containing signal transduction protein
MAHNFYIAKQPIVDLKGQTYGYELLFRTLDSSGSLKAIFKDELLATAKVLVNALNHFGMHSLVSDNIAFVNIDQEFLLDPIILSIPKERFVLEILEDTVVNERTIERVRQLKELGYRLALDDVHCNDGFIERFTPIFPYIDILKLDVSLIKDEALKKYLSSFEKYSFKMLAEKVETKEQYEEYKAYGCELFQGYFFAKPSIEQKESIDPAYKKIFQLINLLDNEYTEIKEIVRELETEVELTIQLLRFINSSYIGLRKEIKSVQQVVMMLGKKPLKQWLLLIAFSKSMQSEAMMAKNPMLELAQNRSKIMAGLAKKMRSSDYDSHEASFVGILSLVDALLRVPIDVILDEINVDSDVEKALLERSGELGKLLDLVVAIEKFDMPRTDGILDELHISNVELSDILQKSYAKA